MRLVATSINGLLDLKNFYPLALEMISRHTIGTDVVHFRASISDTTNIYDGLIVGSDWNENTKLVKAFNDAGKRTILLQSEGMFLEEHKWYAGKVPLTGLACVWGPEHERIFRSRGYEGQIIVTGPPRFDLYNNFVPTLGKEEIYARFGLTDVKKPYILYLGQFFPKHEFGQALYDVQIALTKFAEQTPDGFYGLVKCHPQEAASSYFSRAALLEGSTRANVRVVDRGGHTEEVDISTLLYHAAAVVTYSSTAAIEAMFLGRPAGIFECGTPSPLGNGKFTSLPRVSSSKDLLELATSPVDMGTCKSFVERFLPGRFTGSFTATAADAIASFMKGLALPTPKEFQPTMKAERTNPTPIPESEKQVATSETFRKVCLRAYTDLANVILKTAPNFSGESIKPFLTKPKSEKFKEDDYYQDLHDKDYGYQTNNWLLPELSTLKGAGAQSIIEIGCGNGKFVRAAAGIARTVIGIDQAESPQLKNLPANASFKRLNIVRDALPSADLICSADVLEHIQPDLLIPLLQKLHQAAARQYHLIACYDDGHSHETIASPGVWLAMFKHLSPQYRITDVRPRRNNPDQQICVITNW